MNNSIVELSEREHILKRPNMYIGAVDKVTVQDYFYLNNKITYDSVSYVPGFIKIINEIIDNSVDIAIKTNFKCNSIKVKIADDYVEVSDNGIGIPVELSGDKYMPELAWGRARAGSNFNDDDSHVQIGMNGIGSFATNCFSKKFIGISDDGKLRCTCIFTDNASKCETKVEDSKSQGVTVKFYPDLTRFHLSNIDQIHQSIINQRLLNLAISFPKIKFSFNGKLIKTNKFKDYIGLFGNTYELYESDNYQFAVLPNELDEFRQFSYVNGLKISDGGTHIDILSNTLTSKIREKLERKYKSIKPADIKNKLFIVAFLKNVPNLKFSSQAKEKITNSVAEINKYFGDIDWDGFSKRVLKNANIIDPITEIYRIKEEFKRRQELKSLDKPKRIKNDNYLPAIGKKKYLLITEGLSATGGVLPVLGRAECGYYMLKGKPLNAYSSSQKRFTENKELTGLFQIIKDGVEYYDMPDGQFYEIEVNGKKVIASENDEVLVSNKWISVKRLLKKAGIKTESADW